MTGTILREEVLPRKTKLLKVIKRRQILMLAMNKQISQRKAAGELGPSLSHTKLLLRRLRGAGGNIHCLLYQRRHSAWNRLSQQVRNAVVALREERPRRSNPLIVEPMNELYGIKVHSSAVRKILIEAGKHIRSKR